jgi:hypothetical protein
MARSSCSRSSRARGRQARADAARGCPGLARDRQLPIFDQLEPLSLENAREGIPIPVLADRNGRWHFLELRQARDERLSTFTFEWSSGSNSLAFSDVENVSPLPLDLASSKLGLRAQEPLHVDIPTRTLDPLDVALRGHAARPTVLGTRLGCEVEWEARDVALPPHIRTWFRAGNQVGMRGGIGGPRRRASTSHSDLVPLPCDHDGCADACEILLG